jgi:hypothetical protein
MSHKKKAALTFRGAAFLPFFVGWSAVMELNPQFTEIQDVFPDTEGARRVSAMDGASQIFEQFSTNHYSIRSTSLSTTQPSQAVHCRTGIQNINIRFGSKAAS